MSPVLRAKPPHTAAADHVAASVDNDAVHEVRVERQAVAQLLDEFEHAYERERDTEVENQPYRMRFFHQEPRYTYSPTRITWSPIGCAGWAAKCADRRSGHAGGCRSLGDGSGDRRHVTLFVAVWCQLLA